MQLLIIRAVTMRNCNKARMGAAFGSCFDGGCCLWREFLGISLGRNVDVERGSFVEQKT